MDSAMNSEQGQRIITICQGEVLVSRDNGIKVEVKPEPVDVSNACVVCGARAAGEGVDLLGTTTTCGTSLLRFLCKFTSADLTTTGQRYVCKTCFQLVNVLEQAELEYLKLKETFESIISKNPLFEYQLPVNAVKIESQIYGKVSDGNDSEDEPLAVTKKKRTVRKKKPVYQAPKVQTRKRQRKTDTRWQCTECNECGETGGPEALSAHIMAMHQAKELPDVKKEDSVDDSENSQINNGMDSIFKEESDHFDEDDDLDDDYQVLFEPPKKKKGAGRPRKKQQDGAKKKELHQCTECDAKYTSLRRLEAHQEKHAGGKPPFICEVCGARYKHKRACDIHVALHKGISDWKCEECNKLFPSKGALQRHNNIHTGKLNYQCDLCGKSFIHTSSFKMHKLSHSGIKPHSCDVCGLALMTRSHLKRHKRVHSGEKRHECRVCGKRFSESTVSSRSVSGPKGLLGPGRMPFIPSLRVLASTQHNMFLPKNNKYNLAAHSKSHEGVAEMPQLPRRRLFRCPYCQERFERRYMLERHVSAAHNRTLERLPPTPRNTMSKLLKAQAQARQHAAPDTTARDVATPATDVSETKEERSPEAARRGALALAAPHKLTLSTTSTTISSGSWSGAYADFNMRHDFDMRH